MTRTTPPRPVDIAAVFPEIKELARITTRLHPRAGAPGVKDSSVGGPLLWPADEPWPVCTKSHYMDGILERLDIERRRRLILAASRGRRFTPEEQAEIIRLGEIPVSPPEEPFTLLAVAQLYCRDIPDLVAPPGMDMLQVLWCPFDHDGDGMYCPAVTLRWRRSADVVDVIDPQPEPEVMGYGYLPNPCVLHPEQVTEYPYWDFLPDDLGRRLAEWEDDSEHSYQCDLSIASGWKIGGYSQWNLTDGYPMDCECGTAMELLFMIDSSEWDGIISWRPREDDDSDDPNPPGVTISRGYRLWIFTCPDSFDHPHEMSIQ
ncbi:hypothetical protein [Actinomadura sp. 9N407]|uniref:hypothetical protein n=1 Tax=Actinomadura sp. 9N407 TaxID=3375154 RepID=UPI003788ADE4